MLWIRLWSLCLLLLLGCSAAQKTIERHLIIQGCKRSPFWIRMRDTLAARIDFATVNCIASEQEEQDAIDLVLRRKIGQPELDVHFVATLLQNNHCDVFSECRAVNTGDKYLPLLRAGAKGWYIENEPHFETLGVNRTAENIVSYELFPDNANGGRQVAEEFCRISASIAPATIAVLYGTPEAAHSAARIDNFIAGLAEYCPEDRHVIKYAFYADWNADKAAAVMSPVFLRDSTVDAVIAANDDMALGALVSAREMRPDKYLLVGGYDANEYVMPLLQSGQMFATVDQNPPTGLVYSLEVMLSDEANGAADFGKPTVCSASPGPTCRVEDYNTIQASAWDELIQALPHKVSTAVAVRVNDPSALVLRERLLLYNRAKRPPLSSSDITKFLEGELTPIPILTQMKNTKVYELNAESSSILAQGLLVLTWEDSRLAWSEVEYPDISFIRVSTADIWKPVVVLSNLLKAGTTQPMTNVQTTVYPNGTVVWEQTVNAGEFRCGSIEETVFKFPFDVHFCGIDVTSYAVGEYTLVASHNDFEVQVANADWFQGRRRVNIENTTQLETVEYRVEMERDPLFVQLALIVPSFLLNTISFSQHYIPTRTDQINLDRGGMAITTILAALALRDSMVDTVGTAFTLLDLFLLISLVFQFIGFMITAYESSYGVCKDHNGENTLGIGDRLGKVIVPIIFGIFNLILSLFWGGQIWSLFYMSLALSLGVTILARKDRQRFQKGLREKVSHSIHSVTLRGKLGFGHKGDDENKHSQENIARYWKWITVKSNILGERRGHHGTEKEGQKPPEGRKDHISSRSDGTLPTRQFSSFFAESSDGTPQEKGERMEVVFERNSTASFGQDLFEAPFASAGAPAAMPDMITFNEEDPEEQKTMTSAACTVQRAFRRHARRVHGKDDEECVVM